MHDSVVRFVEPLRAQLIEEVWLGNFGLWWTSPWPSTGQCRWRTRRRLWDRWTDRMLSLARAPTSGGINLWSYRRCINIIVIIIDDHINACHAPLIVHSFARRDRHSLVHIGFMMGYGALGNALADWVDILCNIDSCIDQPKSCTVYCDYFRAACFFFVDFQILKHSIIHLDSECIEVLSTVSLYEL